MNKEFIDQFKKVLSDFEIARANKHLRKIFLIYLNSEHQNLPINFEELLLDVEKLFELFDFIEIEIKEFPEN